MSSLVIYRAACPACGEDSRWTAVGQATGNSDCLADLRIDCPCVLRENETAGLPTWTGFPG